MCVYQIKTVKIMQKTLKVAVFYTHTHTHTHTRLNTAKEKITEFEAYRQHCL